MREPGHLLQVSADALRFMARGCYGVVPPGEGIGVDKSLKAVDGDGALFRRAVGLAEEAWARGYALRIGLGCDGGAAVADKQLADSPRLAVSQVYCLG